MAHGRRGEPHLWGASPGVDGPEFNALPARFNLHAVIEHPNATGVHRRGAHSGNIGGQGTSRPVVKKRVARRLQNFFGHCTKNRKT